MMILDLLLKLWPVVTVVAGGGFTLYKYRTNQHARAEAIDRARQAKAEELAASALTEARKQVERQYEARVTDLLAQLAAKDQETARLMAWLQQVLLQQGHHSGPTP